MNEKFREELKISASCQIPVLRHFYATYLPTIGFFVEVGAYDGESFSNTSCLADFGWHGIYIEPHPKHAAKCRLRHPSDNIEVIQAAAGSRFGSLRISDQGPLSTASEMTKRAYEKIEWAKPVVSSGVLEVQTLTLDYILQSRGIYPKFELLVVDVEGYEEEVFEAFDLGFWTPTMLIVELCDYHDSFQIDPQLQNSARRVRKRVLDSGYLQVYADDIDTIFVRRT